MTNTFAASTCLEPVHRPSGLVLTAVSLSAVIGCYHGESRPADEQAGTDGQTETSSDGGAMCNDGVLDPGEQCDDGNDLDTDACPTTCVDASCGDGFIRANSLEQCDDGNKDDDDECRNDCTLPSCRDGILQASEECDDGNDVDTDECTNHCTLPTCGDGVRSSTEEADEECDDGNDAAGDGCAPDCTDESKIAFVTSEVFDGALGGLEGADTLCNEIASLAGLHGEYLAWLSEPNNDVATRFNHATVPYRTVTGIKIADGWDDLIGGQLQDLLDVDENGETLTYDFVCPVWTGTQDDGTWQMPLTTCNAWTSASADDTGATGECSQTSIWSYYSVDLYTCSSEIPLYCFQQ